MSRTLCVALGFCIVFWGCAPKSETKPTPPSSPSSASGTEPPGAVTEPSAEQGRMTMEGIDLYLHKTDPTHGGVRKPSFWVHAQRFALSEDKKWSFENARAVIYGKEEAEAIVVHADRGDFEEDKRAVLRGNVEAEFGTMHLALQQLVWENPQNDQRGVAVGEGPVLLKDVTMDLSADRAEIYPEEKEFTLENVTGYIRFERNAEGTARDS